MLNYDETKSVRNNIYNFYTGFYVLLNDYESLYLL